MGENTPGLGTNARAASRRHFHLQQAAAQCGSGADSQRLASVHARSEGQPTLPLNTIVARHSPSSAIMMTMTMTLSLLLQRGASVTGISPPNSRRAALCRCIPWLG